MASHEKKYLIDANVFMEASRRYYQFRFAAKFWDELVNYAEEEKIVSIDRVFQEIKAGEDDLKQWAKEYFRNAFDTTRCDEVLSAYQKVIQWADSESKYTQIAKDKFMEETNADAWICAYAMAYDCIVVTHEAFNASIKKQIKVPNVCDAFNIEWIDTFDMLNIFGFSF